ncbi:THAP domain-containing protein 5 isoform X4 [Canis lupus baileyi]|uniref:THAP domain-containing protein 5 isoform X4 n=1 Tax=Canis lupus familiaris TaxID=9615 RepID=UPI000BAA14A8|nr:THAP domain-containing protein 5 isoform X4 [Canis lupus familiaris]XP_035554298.1 THAP domain-containing protein 5 isoform X4 [Canis lupus dingo]XP_038542908.1 THAP domain-containing protein 5 isoform X4 [Canis lupus familiaris]|eukprot:XP_022283291.1 THAP domain-containing protein 5 isoform X4 [Canis lupus familiaris]
MPRYCAAICCKNRRGRNSKDRKLSFYPFPLHDKERLEKWLKNMKRDSWVPSKYQFLCSDHFTPDSLDIRWGIRYLKQTAIPTIFSLPEDDQNLCHSEEIDSMSQLQRWDSNLRLSTRRAYWASPWSQEEDGRHMEWN